MVNEQGADMVCLTITGCDPMGWPSELMTQRHQIARGITALKEIGTDRDLHKGIGFDGIRQAQASS
jgi:hypothetical protein